MQNQQTRELISARKTLHKSTPLCVDSTTVPTNTEGNELFRPLKSSVRADKPLRPKVQMIVPDVWVVQHGLQRGQDDGVFGQVVPTQHRLLAQSVMKGKGRDVGQAHHLHDGGLHVRQFRSIAHARGAVSSDNAAQLVIALVLNVGVVEEEDEGPTKGSGRGLGSREEKICQKL